MEQSTQKLVHTFGALADLGQEITDSSDFSHMVLTSLHLLLGALAIRRGAIAEYSSEESTLRSVATRGLDATFPEVLPLDEHAKASLLGVELSAIPLASLESQNPELNELFAACHSSFGIQLIVPTVYEFTVAQFAVMKFIEVAASAKLNVAFYGTKGYSA